jgi:hypothetical protein
MNPHPLQPLSIFEVPVSRQPVPFAPAFRWSGQWRVDRRVGLQACALGLAHQSFSRSSIHTIWSHRRFFCPCENLSYRAVLP